MGQMRWGMHHHHHHLLLLLQVDLQVWGGRCEVRLRRDAQSQVHVAGLEPQLASPQEADQIPCLQRRSLGTALVRISRC